MSHVVTHWISSKMSCRIRYTVCNLIISVGFFSTHSQGISSCRFLVLNSASKVQCSNISWMSPRARHADGKGQVKWILPWEFWWCFCPESKNTKIWNLPHYDGKAQSTVACNNPLGQTFESPKETWSDPTRRREKWSMVTTLPFSSIFSVKTQ